MQKLKVNDEVIIICGKDKGRRGKIKKILKKKDTVLVENLNLVNKTSRATKENPNGAITKKEAPIHRSNVALVDAKTSKATKIGVSVMGDKRVRMAKKSGVEITK